MIKSPVPFVALSALAAASALAQTPPDPAPGNTQRQREVQVVREVALAGADDARHRALAFVGDSALAPQRVVKGAPYCADAVSENVQWLADPDGGAANRIVQRQTTRLCRDGEGRTRQEHERGGRKWVHLNDPVARESWVLDPERKTARRGTSLARFDTDAFREHAERIREWAREWAGRMQPGASTAPTPPLPPLPPMPPMSSMRDGSAAPAIIVTPSADPAERQREVRVQVLRLDGAPMEMPVAVQSQVRKLAPRGAGVVSSMPAKEIDGLRVNGERTTWTIDAGMEGNERPIVISREVWTSPELMLTVQSRDFDPRSGEILYRLQNLRRGEPDPALMRVPADYTQPKPAERAPQRPG